MIYYLHFWKNFEKEKSLVHKNFFSKIFPINYPILIVNVFPNTLPLFPSKGLRVSFSGEVYHQSTQHFQINLIMKETNIAQGIVCTTLFSLMCYERNLWTQLLQKRTLSPKTKFCAMTVSNPTVNTRIKFFQLLNAKKKVDSVGKAFNNCKGFVLPNEKEKEVLNNYKFMICFENTKSSHYLTEKLLFAYLNNTIPIYYGATISQEWLNPKAFLYLENDSDEAMNKLIDQIKELDKNEEAYLKMFEESLLKEDKIPYELSIEYVVDNIKKILQR